MKRGVISVSKQLLIRNQNKAIIMFLAKRTLLVPLRERVVHVSL